MRKHFDEAMVLYQSMLDMGIAKGMFAFCASTRYAHKNLYVGFL